jgi:hypothetical protein
VSVCATTGSLPQLKRETRASSARDKGERLRADRTADPICRSRPSPRGLPSRRRMRRRDRPWTMMRLIAAANNRARHRSWDDITSHSRCSSKRVGALAGCCQTFVRQHNLGSDRRVAQSVGRTRGGSRTNRTPPPGNMASPWLNDVGESRPCPRPEIVDARISHHGSNDV